MFFLITTRVWNEDEFLSISYFPEEVEHIARKINPLFGIKRIFPEHFEAYHKLTRREKQILDFLAKNLSRCQIASELFVAKTTIKKHCENIDRTVLSTNSNFFLSILLI